MIVEHYVMVRWIIGSIPRGGPIEQFPHSIQCSTTGLTKAMVCAILVGAYKRSIAVIRKE